MSAAGEAVQAAVLAHRADPTPDTEKALYAAQVAYVESFHRAQAAEFAALVRAR